MEIIIPHRNTDLDAIGAAVGAQVLYPHAQIVLPGPPSPLAGEFLSLHRYNLRVRSAREIEPHRVRRAIVVDTADPERLGPLRHLVAGCEVHLYDHHPPDAGDLQASLEVRDPVGATCTLLAELIEEAGVPITPFQATAMLVGIYADTGSLRLLSTTERDARAVAFLLANGANLQVASRFLEISLSPVQQALMQQLQSSARWVAVNGGRIRLMAAEVPEYVEGLSLIVHRLQELDPAPALFVAVRMDDRIYLVGRATVPWVDTARILGIFGGGGHRSAASAVVKGEPLSEVMQRLEEALPLGVERLPLARDVMSAPVKTISAEKTIREAERLMLRYGHTGLPVVDEAGRLIGIISLRDVEKARRHGLEHAPVKGVMRSRVVTVSPETPLEEVQGLMIERDIGRVPVVNGNALVGIITRSDLLGLLYGGPVPRWHRTLYARGDEAAPDRSLHRVMEAVARAPAAVQSLLTTAGEMAEASGVAVYAVGGFVRDLLLGRPNLDVDLVVEGDGIAFAHALARRLGAEVKAVPRFGSAHIYLPSADSNLPPKIDVSTARREFYEHAAALPQVEHADLREDLYRRDFTINAMAIRLGPRGPVGLVDFFGGLADLANGQVRILHTLSFVEDPTRIIRGVRFAHRYGFRLEPETEACARSAVREGFLERVSRERLRTELVLLLEEEASGGALRMLHDLGAYDLLLPGAGLDEDRLRLVDAVDGLAGKEPEIWQQARRWLVKLMVLLRPLPPEEGALLAERLKLRRSERQALLHALAGWRTALETICNPDAAPAEVVGTLGNWPPEGLLLLCLLGGEEPVSAFWHRWRKVRLAIDGNDLRRIGVQPGPRVGRILSRVLSDCLEGKAPDRETQLSLARRYALEED